MIKVLRVVVLAALCLFASGEAAMAQRKSAVVSEIQIDSGVGDLPSAYSMAVLKRELETALEATGLFTAPQTDRGDLNQVINEMIRTGRRGARAIPAEYLISTKLVALSLDERRRPAPNMRDRDLVTVNGSMALRVTVMQASTGAVKVRFPLEVSYASKPRITDPVGNGDLGPYNAQTKASAASADFVALSQEAGRALARRMLDQVNPALVIQKTGDQVWISRGEDAGYTIGQTLRVFKVGPDLRNPVTGEVLDKQYLPIGEARVTEILPRVSVAKIVSATEDIGIGTIVREVVETDQ